MYGDELLKDSHLIKGITTYNKHDLYYTVGTAYTLEGTNGLKAVDLFKECLYFVDQNNKEVTDSQLLLNWGYALNNIGMTQFWEFIN